MTVTVRNRYVGATIGLNLRAGPSTDYPVIDALPFGTPVEVLEEGTWALVRVGDDSGFVSSQYLTDVDPLRRGNGADTEMGTFRFRVWPTVEKRVTQPFGVNPDDYKAFNLPGHEGIDLAAPLDTPYFCVAPGKVIWVSDRRRNGTMSAYGWHVIVDHGNGYTTLYAHARPDVPVKPGDLLEAGDVVAFSGKTGRADGAHLHLTLKKQGFGLAGWPPGYMDPWPFLRSLMA